MEQVSAGARTAERPWGRFKKNERKLLVATALYVGGPSTVDRIVAWYSKILAPGGITAAQRKSEIHACRERCMQLADRNKYSNPYLTARPKRFPRRGEKRGRSRTIFSLRAKGDRVLRGILAEEYDGLTPRMKDFFLAAGIDPETLQRVRDPLPPGTLPQVPSSATPSQPPLA